MPRTPRQALNDLLVALLDGLTKLVGRSEGQAAIAGVLAEGLAFHRWEGVLAVLAAYIGQRGLVKMRGYADKLEGNRDAIQA